MTTIRPLTSADADALLDLTDYAFIADPGRPWRESLLEQVDFNNTFGAFRDGEQVGGYLFYDLTVAEPGPLGTVCAQPLPGLSWVSVHPDHRRRGVLSAMIRHHLADLRERGAAWSGLTASDPRIYGRFGYAVATLAVRYRVRQGARLQAPEPVARAADDVSVRTLFAIDDDAIAARLRAITLEGAATALGVLTWPEGKERGSLRDVPDSRRDLEPLHALVATRGGRDVGAVVYRRTSDWPAQPPNGRLEVQRMIALDAGAALALGRRLVAEELIEQVVLPDRGLDDPLLWWAGGPRAAEPTVSDGLWLRPVDVGAALSRRGYAAPCDVTLQIADPTCPWNERRWRLVVGDDGVGRCEPVEGNGTADVEAPVQALGAVHLGLRGWAALAAAGEVVEHRARALAELGRAFATSVTPVGGLEF